MTRNREMQKLNQMSRRRFMTALAGLGVSASAIPGMTQETYADLIDDPQKEVPRVAAFVHTNHEEVTQGAAPERVPIYYSPLPGSDECTIAGIHQGWNDDEYTVATSMYRIEEQFDVTI